MLLIIFLINIVSGYILFKSIRKRNLKGFLALICRHPLWTALFYLSLFLVTIIYIFLSGIDIKDNVISIHTLNGVIMILTELSFLVVSFLLCLKFSDSRKVNKDKSVHIINKKSKTISFLSSLVLSITLINAVSVLVITPEFNLERKAKEYR